MVENWCVADAVFINVRRENEDKTLDLQTFSMINMISVTEIFFKGGQAIRARLISLHFST